MPNDSGREGQSALPSSATDVCVDETRFREFMGLAADWYWELDADLRYVFHEGHPLPMPGQAPIDVIGRSRPEALRQAIGASESLVEHDRLMHAHHPIDLVLSTDVAPEVRRHVRVVAVPLFDTAGKFSGYRGCGRDETERVRLRERYARLALRDELTGLFNRREFRSRLETAHALVLLDENVERTLCLIDLDRFKLVNDTAGHTAGDVLLKEIAAIMGRYVAPSETLARFGGDEFAILLDTGPAGARRRMQLMIDAIAAHEFVWDERTFSVGASIGITALDETGDAVGTFIDLADAACYAAKADGRNRSVVFTPDSDAYRRHREEIAQIEVIKEALRANRLRLYMQPIEPASGPIGRPHHEILLRLEAEDGELMAPSTFIPIAERFLIMQDLDLWVIENCIDAIELFTEHGVALSLSINLSGNSLSDQSSLERIHETVSDSGVDPSRLCFEITESTAITNIGPVIDFMHAMKRLGARFALDDFGAGLSSFAYIRSLPIDFLKIDGYFIRNLRSDTTNRAITAAFIQMSSDLGIATVAECVEDKATRRTVAEMGIDYVQGFGVARPIDVVTALASAAARSRERTATG